MSNEFWAGIVGAIVGAFVGGFVTWLLQHFEAKRQRKARNQALAQSLLFKLLRIASDLTKLENHVEACEARARKVGIRIGWQSLRPIANLPGSIVFTADEMGYIIELKDIDLLNNLYSLDMRHSTAIDMFARYDAERTKTTASVSGEVFEEDETIILCDEDVRRIASRGAELDTLVNAIRASASNDAERARNVLSRAGEVLTPTLGFHPILKMVAGEYKVLQQ